MIIFLVYLACWCVLDKHPKSNVICCLILFYLTEFSLEIKPQTMQKLVFFVLTIFVSIFITGTHFLNIDATGNL